MAWYEGVEWEVQHDFDIDKEAEFGKVWKWIEGPKKKLSKTELRWKRKAAIWAGLDPDWPEKPAYTEREIADVVETMRAVHAASSRQKPIKQTRW